MVDEAVNLERSNWVEECGRINSAYTEAQENLEQAKVRCRLSDESSCVPYVTQRQEREIRIVGELKQSKEQHKRDTVKLSSERDALEDAGKLHGPCVLRIS